MTGTTPWLTAAWMVALCAVGYGLYRLGARWLTKRGRTAGRFAIGFLFVYTIAVSVVVLCLKQRAERQQLLQWAERMADPRDLESERLFAERVALLPADTAACALVAALNGADEDGAALDSLDAYLKRHYFTNHWRGYHFYLTLCRSDASLQIDPSDIVPCLDFFAEKIDRIGAATDCDGLYAMNYGLEYNSYLYAGVLTDGPTGGADSNPLYVFAEWGRSKISQPRMEMPAAYSYAYYVDGALWNRRGHYLYDFDISERDWAAETPVFIRQDGYLHCVLELSPSQLLIVTAPALKPVTLLYYGSFFLCLFFVAGFLLESLLRRNTLFKAKTYAKRLQYTIFGLVACAFAILGIVSLFFIREIDRDEQTDRLKEKSLSALTALESRFMDFTPDEFPMAGRSRQGGGTATDTVLTQTGRYLNDLARVLLTDLYLFDRDGHFLLSSLTSADRPQPLCRQPFFRELQARNSHLLIREDPTLTAYAPLRNADNDILGYVMLPYNRDNLNWQTVMHRYWGAYLSLFVGISLLTLLAAYLLSRYVTRPLKLLSRQMGALQLTDDRLSAPPALVWRAQDEIGSLVDQYNRMTAQLADSIRQLAEAERQSAWQQMARQVAHEIKNPLTPLQLQMQQLERAYHDRRPDFEARLTRFADLLRTQIASLTRMADTFSQLALWQQPQLQTLDLREAVDSAAALFPAPTAFSFDLPDGTAIRADAQWLRQILTNLFRNAVQAQEEAGTPHPQINIKASLQETCLLLHVRDNGPGIAPERQERIFEPHFTTRSSGSGLGLAISRRLAEGMQG
ncbi:MAG: HAMP domain-containing protein, partial [Bacteroidales bacterium]|nr:HAMP domain-containing protein [Bacteroidales bacterium]